MSLPWITFTTFYFTLKRIESLLKRKIIETFNQIIAKAHSLAQIRENYHIKLLLKAQNSINDQK